MTAEVEPAVHHIKEQDAGRGFGAVERFPRVPGNAGQLS